MLRSGCHDHRLYLERLLITVVVAILLRAMADPIGRVLPIGDVGTVAIAALLVAAVLSVFTCVRGSGRTRPGPELTGNTS